MESDHHRNPTSNAIGFFLLPSELIQYIILQLALPDIVRLKSVNKAVASIISDQHFVRYYNFRSSSTTNWLFIYKKRWRRDAILHGYTNCYSDRWFKIFIADILKPVVPPGEDLYLLAASEMMNENGPILFEYDSRTEQWRSTQVIEEGRVERTISTIFLSAFNGRSGSIIIAKDPHCDTPPVILRPRFVSPEEDVDGRLAVGFSATDRLHVYGDGNMMIVKSNGVEGENNNRRVRMLEGIELWGLSSTSNGRFWEFISRVPGYLVEKIKKPYGAMMGCLEQRHDDGVVRVILMSNLEGSWDIIWIRYDMRSKIWTWLPIPDCKMKGANMAGIAFSSCLTLI
ncbi:hypothetical protein M9H77_01908 [Catharanthus roseus]|uniref:Uncharacterized protein n=1 Tax=Catharanthus roseus TaxID=4058 RepID=A0ACC0C7B9_CATRO|nr:hypothetical protein M9H77_01908 [Catharanthus roseus]